MSNKRRPTDTQRDALVSLQELARGESPLTNVADLGVVDGQALIGITLRTAGLLAAPGGLHLNDEEEFILQIPRGFPWRPPTATVDHERFVGFPKVLQGTRLCVYLNPSQEWHPKRGIVGFLEDMWKWLEDAAAGRFDASNALYHPVGGVVHHTPGTPTIVVRSPLRIGTSAFRRASLRPRTGERLDLFDVAGGPADGDEPVLLVALPGALAYGAGTTVAALLARIARVGHPKPTDLTAVMAQTASRGRPGTPLYFILAVPFPSKAGTMDHHLIGGRLPAEAADSLRRAVAGAGALADVSARDLPLDAPIEWCLISDERDSITTRRDTTRPVSSLLETHVEIWGCGGLGAWIAEFAARAGVKKITLVDATTVTGGLLVRQDYAEEDIGRSKATALAARLRAVRDDLVIETKIGPIPGVLGQVDLPACDLLIDATVNASVGAWLAQVWDVTTNRQLVARVAVDVPTATIGLAAIARVGGKPNLDELDDFAGKEVLANAEQERFHVLWQPPGATDEVIPTRGCSVPTFHGSAADLAAISGVLLSLVASHLGSDASGVHLAALPHAPGTGAAHTWLPFQ